MVSGEFFINIVCNEIEESHVVSIHIHSPTSRVNHTHVSHMILLHSSAVPMNAMIGAVSFLSYWSLRSWHLLQHDETEGNRK